MNYYNPYFYTVPTTALNTTRTGLFSRLFGGLTFSRFIDGTQRALNFANQAIPFIRQVRPMIGNAKTMFKVMNEFKKSEKPKQTSNYTKSKVVNNNLENKTYNTTDSGPTFFM